MLGGFATPIASRPALASAYAHHARAVHRLAGASASAPPADATGEPPYTTLTPRRCHTIDYIFYDANMMEVRARRIAVARPWCGAVDRSGRGSEFAVGRDPCRHLSSANHSRRPPPQVSSLLTVPAPSSLLLDMGPLGWLSQVPGATVDTARAVAREVALLSGEKHGVCALAPSAVFGAVRHPGDPSLAAVADGVAGLSVSGLEAICRGLPNSVCGSDHIPLVATLQWRDSPRVSGTQE